MTAPKMQQPGNWSVYVYKGGKCTLAGASAAIDIHSRAELDAIGRAIEAGKRAYDAANIKTMAQRLEEEMRKLDQGG
jgi:hypothetical protein